MSASQAELLAKVLNMFVAFVAVVVFTWLTRKYRREQLTYIFSTFFIFSYIIFSTQISAPASATVWTFYLFGDLFSTLMVATFFAFLNDSVTPESAKRLYGIIGFGGVTGGVFGTSVLRIWIDNITSAQWLWICAVIAIAIGVIAYFAGTFVRKNPPVYKEEEPEEEEETNENPALEGAKLVFKSSYLLAIVGIVGLYEIVSQLLDFQFTSTVAHYLDGPEIGKQFSTVFSITNWVSMIVQLFLTSFVMTRFGIATALAILPVAILIGSAGFIVFPALWVGSMLNTADNGFSYSINQSAKETLYVPTSRNEKYRAKAFIDMFIQRLAKSVAVVLSLGVTMLFSDFSSIRYLSIFTLVAVIAWLFIVRYAGRKFDELSSDISE